MIDEELSYDHFHKNPEQLISKDPFHLLSEEIKKNKTGSPSYSVDKEVLKTIISNRIKEKLELQQKSGQSVKVVMQFVVGLGCVGLVPV